MPLIVRASLPEGEIYSSGAITIRDLKPLTLLLMSAIGETPYEIRLIFEKDEKHFSEVRWEALKSGGMEIRIRNFDSPMGLTPLGPINIGSYEGREILLDFVIYTLGDPKNAPKLFCYTLRAGN